MIDFKITFQNDELIYGDHEKNSVISKIMLRNLLQQLNSRRHNHLRKIKRLCVAKETYQPLWIWYFNCVSYSNCSILFYYNWPDLSKVMPF